MSTLTALTAGKLGSSTSHFVEWMVACYMCAGMGYFFLLSNHGARAVSITVLLNAHFDEPKSKRSKRSVPLGAKSIEFSQLASQPE
jgi:hypothetical protein